MRKVVYLKSSSRVKFISTKTLSLCLMVIGFLLIVFALWPIISFNIILAPRFTAMIKPVPDSLLLKSNPKASFSSVSKAIVEAEESLIEKADDYTKASVWFPNKIAVEYNQEDSLNYYLSVPTLKIKDAKVVVGGEDLAKSLIQYGGTALPGEYGNTVIFGHSVLPYFYNPKDYNTIFSTLPSLQENDQILITYEGITYTYKIEEMYVVNPDDVSILEQRFDDSYLSLITCVPPGTYEKRLWVRARINKI